MSSLDIYTVRPFEPRTDLEGACKAFVDGFHHILWPIIEHADGLVEDIILTFHEMGACSYVAEADGEARGILVGGLPFDTRYVVKDVRLALGLGWRWLAGSGRSRSRPFARACLRRVIIGYLPYEYLHPRTKSTETFLLTSQSGWRGGIGRVLMDAWTAESRARGYVRSTVCTDSQLSWDFYERYGFKRVREFQSSAYYYSLPGTDVSGYIYSLDL
ncbi:MAG: GNAT family N-acetyltransferase [Candidatus Geothermincolia bacterium]